MRSVCEVRVCVVEQQSELPPCVPSKGVDVFEHNGRAQPIEAPNPAVARARDLLSRQENAQALALVEAELARHPDDPELQVILARLLVRTGELDRALPAARRAWAAVEDGPLAVEAGVVLAAAERYRGDGQRALELLRAALDLDCDSALAHRGLAELVLPDFASPHRPAIERAFAAANHAYQAGDLRAVRSLAQQILALDPNEGLAHALCATALEHLRAGGAELVSGLDTDIGRRALVRELERILGPSLPDFLPDWENLTEMQRATVARSALAYGAVLPRLARRGLVIRLVLPGTSATAVDADIDADFERNLGRYAWAGRGWQRSGLVLAGVEKLFDAARGGHDTIAHELAHALEGLMWEAQQKRRIEGDEALSPVEATLARAPERIRTLFESARTFFDAYSRQDEHEYFAQGMMASLSPTGAARLRRRDPALYDLVREVVGATHSYPPLSPLIDHGF